MTNTARQDIAAAADRAGWTPHRIGNFGDGYSRDGVVVRVQYTRTGAVREWARDSDGRDRFDGNQDVHGAGKRANVLAVLAEPRAGWLPSELAMVIEEALAEQRRHREGSQAWQELEANRARLDWYWRELMATTAS